MADHDRTDETDDDTRADDEIATYCDRFHESFTLPLHCKAFPTERSEQQTIVDWYNSNLDLIGRFVYQTLDVIRLERTECDERTGDANASNLWRTVDAFAMSHAAYVVASVALFNDDVKAAFSQDSPKSKQ